VLEWYDFGVYGYLATTMFLLGILVGILGAYLRWRLNDTPSSSRSSNRGKSPRRR
jgi:hypothetical protein